jgi:hypothetical protein
MAYDVPFYHLTFGGRQMTNAEIWACTVNYVPEPHVGTGPMLDALGQISLQDIYDAIKPLFTTAQGDRRYSTAQSLDYVKLAVIDTDGDYAGNAKSYAATTSGIAATPGPPPPQLAYVVSLWDGITTGTGHHGRFYMPLPCDTMTVLGPTDGKMSSALVTVLRDTWKTTLHAIQGEISTIAVPVQLAIMSQSGGGKHALVTQIGVGRVVDTQRRRRNALDDSKAWVSY